MATQPSLFPEGVRISTPKPKPKPKAHDRRAKWHYHVLVCPHCGEAFMSLRRVRHTYVSMRNWLTKEFNLKRFFSKTWATKYVRYTNEMKGEKSCTDNR